jgi:hypothetical protein
MHKRLVCGPLQLQCQSNSRWRVCSFRGSILSGMRPRRCASISSCIMQLHAFTRDTHERPCSAISAARIDECLTDRTYAAYVAIMDVLLRKNTCSMATVGTCTQQVNLYILAQCQAIMLMNRKMPIDEWLTYILHTCIMIIPPLR